MPLLFLSSRAKERDMDGGFLSCSKGRKEATRMELCCYSGKNSILIGHVLNERRTDTTYEHKALGVVLRD